MIITKKDIKIPFKYKFNKTIIKSISEDNFFIIAAHSCIHQIDSETKPEVRFSTEYGDFSFEINNANYQRDSRLKIPKYHPYENSIHKVYFIIIVPIDNGDRIKYKGICVFDCECNELDDDLKLKLKNDFAKIKEETDFYNLKLIEELNKRWDISNMTEEEKDEMIKIGRKLRAYVLLAVVSIFIPVIGLIISIYFFVKFFKLCSTSSYDGAKYTEICKERRNNPNSPWK